MIYWTLLWSYLSFCMQTFKENSYFRWETSAIETAFIVLAQSCRDLSTDLNNYSTTDRFFIRVWILLLKKEKPWSDLLYKASTAFFIRSEVPYIAASAKRYLPIYCLAPAPHFFQAQFQGRAYGMRSYAALTTVVQS